ncbi:MAG: type IV pilus assembly protein PilM [Deltaproteobacteria bacterium]|nr:type IV pilus assembly protein PilM [Deltaproteobacteria bacterium]
MFPGKRNLIGVDIGSYSVKVVALVGTEGAYTLGGAALFRLPREGDEAAPVTPPFLSGILKAKRIRGSRAAALMSGPSLIFKHLKLPVMPEKDLKEAVRWEVRKDLAIAVSPADLVLDYMTAAKAAKPGDNTLSIIAFAAVRGDVERSISLFRDAGLELRVLEVVPSALLFSFNANNAWEPGVNYAMLDIGETKSTLAILKDKRLSFAREIGIGGADFTKFLASGMGKPVEDAEEYKIAFGLTADDGKEDKARKILSQAVERLCTEVQRSFDYFQAQFREGSVSKLFLSGGSARLKGMEEFVSNIIAVPVFKDDPLRSIRIPKGFDTADLSDIAPCLTVATGLAARKT